MAKTDRDPNGRKTFDNGTGLRVKSDTLPALVKAMAALASREVLVGFPEESADRPSEGGGKQSITNAALAYIHDNGAPEARIPARPFMIPAIESVKPQVTKTLARAAQYALAGEANKVDEGFERVGMLAVKAIRDTINAGIPPALAESTVRARARRGRKGAQEELNRRDAGHGASLQLAKPLIDTAEMLKSSNYVVRARSAREK